MVQLLGRKEQQIFPGYTLQGGGVGVRRMDKVKEANLTPDLGNASLSTQVCSKYPLLRAYPKPIAASKPFLTLQPMVISLALLPATIAPTDHIFVALVLSTGHFATSSSG